MTPEERRALLRAMRLAGLTETKLVILFMHSFGWTQGEIAELLDMDRTSVCYHWRDTVDRLSALCRGGLHGEDPSTP